MTKTNSATPKGRRVHSPLSRITSFVMAFLLLMNTLLCNVSISAETALGAAAEAQAYTTESDASTADAWQAYEYDNTLYVGRIWTDKSVYTEDYTFESGDLTGETIDIGGSDFLVELSAISSTSTEVTTTTTSGYMDIVLVLDVSGSMVNVADVTAYTSDEDWDPVNNTYYVYVNNKLQALTYNSSSGTFTYNGTTYTPKTSSTDTTNGRTQFYRTRIDVLKEAVNEFLAEIADKNTSGNYRVAVVQYAGEIGGSGTEILTCDNTYSGRVSGGRGYETETVAATKIVWDYTSIDSSNLSTYQETISNLTAAGASTGADWGMQVAQMVMNGTTTGSYTANGSTTLSGGGTRSNAESVLIMFTDGVPNHMDTSDAFDTDVATTAIEYANVMKTAGTTIYSVGLDTSASATDTSTNFNKYLNALSSNYPDASSYSNIGTAAASEYYKAVTSASELSSVFSNLASVLEVASSTTGSPTTIVDGYSMDTSGYITFTDTTGEYMEVDSIKSIVYNNVIYTYQEYGTDYSAGTVTSTTYYDANGNEVTDAADAVETKTVTTYTFEAEVVANDAQENGNETKTNLNTILISVESSSDPYTGDVITVKIPASLIPLRAIEIIEDEDGTVTGYIMNEAYPIRVFYGVSIKDGIVEDTTDDEGNVVLAAIKDPDDTLQEYIDSHTDSNGNVYFYSNYYEANEDGTNADNGTTTAVFTPSSSNKFYYFGETTLIYTSIDSVAADGTVTGTPLSATDVSSLSSDTELYYVRAYYTVTDTLATDSYGNQLYDEDGNELYVVTVDYIIRTFTAGDLAVEGGSDHYTTGSDGYVYMTADSPRLTRVSETHRLKSQDTSGNTLAEDGNVTNTALYANNPTWSNDEKTVGVSEVTTYLGNNGRLTVTQPGKLSVSKTVVPYTYDGTEYPDGYEDQLFAFTVTLTSSDSSSVDGTYYYTITDEDGNYYYADGTLLYSAAEDAYYDTNGDVTTDTVSTLLSLTVSNGTATITLKNGMTALIYGLDAGVTYTVQETAVSNYTVSATNDGEAVAANTNGEIIPAGIIAAGETSATAFTNTYSFNSVDVSGLFQVQKQIVDSEGNVISTSEVPWTWVDEDGYWFRFVLQAVSNTAGVAAVDTLPAVADGSTNPTLTVTDSTAVIAYNVYDDQTIDFGEVTYTKPGVYVYDVWERSPITSTDSALGSAIPGLYYSEILYRITVTVEPDGNGGLTYSYVITTVENDAGTTVNEEYYNSADTSYTSDDSVMVITNTYSPDTAEVAFNGYKSYTDESGATTLEAEDFTFVFTALTVDDLTAPTPDGVTTVTVNGNETWTVTNAADSLFNSGSITFSSSLFDTNPDATLYYYYTVSEKEGSLVNMAYDSNTYVIRVTVTYEDLEDASGNLVSQGATADGTKDTVVAIPEYGYFDTNGEFVAYTNGTYPLTDNGRITFTNTYDPTDTTASFSFNKDIDGREWLDSDSFTFELTAGSYTDLDGNEGSVEVPMPSGASNGTLEVTVSGSDADSNGLVAIAFGSITYSKVGIYTYTVKETSTDGNGITVDTTEYTVTVTVTLNETTGALEAEVSYSPEDTTFTNVYESTGTYEGLSIFKTLNGRDMEAGEFEFVVTADDDASAEKLIEAGLIDSGTTYTTTNRASGDGVRSRRVILSDLTFDQDDDGKTFTYYIQETLPTTDDDTETDGLQEDGVTYDQSVYKVEIIVTDNGDGTISTETVITLVTDKNGNKLSTAESADEVAFVNEYAAEGTLAAASIYVAKELIGRSGETDETFTFQITSGGNTVASSIENPMPEENAVTVNGSTVYQIEVTAPTSEGIATTASFGSITYTHAGIYYYYIYEDVTTGNAISTWSQAKYLVVVTVTDNGNGTLTATVTGFYRIVTNGGTELEEGSYVVIDNNTARFWNIYEEDTPVKDVYNADEYSVDPSEAASIDGETVNVGDELTYEVSWTNTAIASDGSPAEATTLTVTDEIPTGTVYVPGTAAASVADKDGTDITGTTDYTISYYDASGDKITDTITTENASDVAKIVWTFTNVEAEATGTVTFNVTVTEDAYTNNNQVTNYAEVQIGENSPVTTNEVTNYVVHKDVYSADDTTTSIDGEVVEDGDVLTYEIEWTNDTTAEGTVTVTDSLPEYTVFVPDSVTVTVDGTDMTSDSTVTITYYDASYEPITDAITAANASDVASIQVVITGVAAEVSGTVTFQVTVDTSDITDGSSVSIDNTATVSIGDNEYNTNTTSNYTPVTENPFAVRKVIVDETGTEIAVTDAPWTSVSSSTYWFRFVLEALDGAPLPEAQTGETSGTNDENNEYLAVNVYNNSTYTFGSVTYTEPGTYVYDIWERSAITAAGSAGAAVTGDPLPGISYSQALYRITVEVTLNADGELETETTVTLVYNDAGTTVNQTYTVGSDGEVVITNTYNKDEEKVAFRGIKLYTDDSGATTLSAGDYEFKFTSVTAYAPVPENDAENGFTVTDNGDGIYSWTVENAADGSFTSPYITYTQSDVGIWYYKVEEVLPDGITAADDEDSETAGIQYKGMTYDDSVYYIQVVVSYIDTDDDNIADTVDVKYYYGNFDDNDNFVQETDAQSEFGRIEFSNSYNPDDAELDTETDFGFTKDLTGREWKEGDTFTFVLTAGTNTTSGDTPMPTGSTTDTETGVVTKTATVTYEDVTDAANPSNAIDFGTITYDTVGTYYYTVSESTTTLGGVKEDTVVREITVVVTYDEANDALVATATVTSGSTTFTNTYTSTGTFKGFSISKTLTGRDMNAGEFTFEVSAADNASALKLYYAGLVASGFGTYTTTNQASNDGIANVWTVLTSLKFTQDDAGQTYTYYVSEMLPTDDDTTTAGIQSKGVTYDQSVYKVEITVTDNLDGTISTSTKIILVKDSDGTELDEDDENNIKTSISFKNSYEAEGTLDGSIYLQVAKTLTGRDGETDETFRFIIEDAGNDIDDLDENPMPEDNNTGETDTNGNTIYATTVEAPADGETAYGAFGDITYTQTGTYYYYIYEDDTTGNAITTWSQAKYMVTVIVTDNGDGTLEVVVDSFDLIVTQDGTELSESEYEAIEDYIALFENEYVDNTPKKEVYSAADTTTSIDGQAVSVGDVLQYSISWTNTSVDTYGKAAAATITVTDTIPAGTVYVAGSAAGTVGESEAGVITFYADEAQTQLLAVTENGTTTYYDTEGNELGSTAPDDFAESVKVIVWTYTNVEAEATGTASFQVTVSEDAEENIITNDAAVKVGENEYDTNQTTNYVQLKDVEEVEGTYSIDETTVGVGSILEYSIDWINPENEDGVTATVTVTDKIPDGTVFVYGSATSDYAAEYTTIQYYNVNGGEINNLTEENASTVKKIVWTLTDVSGGDSGTVSFQAKVTEDAVENADNTVENVATVTIQVGDDPEVTTTTNTTTNYVPEKDVYDADDYTALGSNTSIDGDVVNVSDDDEDEVLTYEISFISAAVDEYGEPAAAAVTVTDEIPAGTEFVAGSTKAYVNGTDVTGTATITCYDESGSEITNVTSSNAASVAKIEWKLADVPYGAEVIVTFNVKVTEEAYENVDYAITNDATVTIGDNDPMYTNEVVNYVVHKDVYAEDDNTASIDGQLVGLDEVLTYSIDWKNSDNSEADITITDLIPDGTDYVNGSATSAATVAGQTDFTVTLYDADGNELDDTEANAGNVAKIEWTFTAEAGASGTVTFQVEVTEGAFELDAVENTATVKIGENTYTTNTTTNTVPVKSAEVLTSDSDELEEGDLVEYTITFTNTPESETSSDTTTVAVTDTLSSGVTYVTYTASVKVDNTALSNAEPDVTTNSDGQQVLTWTLEDVPVDAEVEITFTVKVGSDAPSHITNQADVNGHLTNIVISPVPSDDEKNVLDENNQIIDGEMVEAGDLLTYEISWTNAVKDNSGKDTGEYADTVIIVDTLPDGIEVNTSTISHGGVYAETTDANTGEVTRTITWTFTDLDTDDIVRGTVWFEATVTGDETVITNTAAVNEYEVSVTNYVPVKAVYDADDVGIDGEGVEAGDVLTYTISFVNPAQDEEGAAAAADEIIVTDSIPEGTVYAAGTAAVTINGTAADAEVIYYDASGEVITTVTDENADEVASIQWTLSDVAAEANVTVSFNVIVTASAADNEENAVNNTAIVQIGENGPSYTTNTVTNYVPEEPTKTETTITDAETGESSDAIGSDPDENGTITYNKVTIGDQITYEIAYYNHYDSATTVIITDVLDDGVAYVDGSATDNGIYGDSTHTIIWTLTDVEAHTGGTVSFTVVVTEDAKTLDDGETSAAVENQATVTVGEVTNDTNIVINPLEDDEETEPIKTETVINADTDDEHTAEITETDEDTGDITYEAVAVGDYITYQITYYNHYNETSTVYIYDTLDLGVEYVEDSASDNGIYDSQLRTLYWTLEVPALTGGSVTFTVQVTENAMVLAAGETEATVENTAYVSVGVGNYAETNTVINPLEDDDPQDPVKTEGTVTDGEYTADAPVSSTTDETTGVTTDTYSKVAVGDEVIYQITYYNHTNEIATVVITDVLDDGVDFVSASDDGVYDKNTRTVTWTLTADPYTSGYVTLTVEVNSSAVTQIANTASVTIGNEEAVDTNTVVNPLEEEEESDEPQSDEPETDEPDDEDETTTTKKTGDNNVALMLSLLTAALGVFFVAATTRRRKSR